MRDRIDLNADLGEGCANDAALMELVSSCNIACGGHAGDEASMREALKQAKQNGVAAGAHPSFPDRENFGREPSGLSGKALAEELRGQIASLMKLAEAEGVTLTHVKPHGALYNMAARDAALASVVAETVSGLLPNVALVGPPVSELASAAAKQGLQFKAEGFADRAYEADESLRPRGEPGAVIEDHNAQTEQALQIAKSGSVQTYTGERLDLPVDTICIHGDTVSALEAARAIHAALKASGIRVSAD